MVDVSTSMGCCGSDQSASDRCMGHCDCTRRSMQQDVGVCTVTNPSARQSVNSANCQLNSSGPQRPHSIRPAGANSFGGGPNTAEKTARSNVADTRGIVSAQDKKSKWIDSRLPKGEAGIAYYLQYPCLHPSYIPTMLEISTSQDKSGVNRSCCSSAAILRLQCGRPSHFALFGSRSPIASARSFRVGPAPATRVKGTHLRPEATHTEL